MPENISLHIEGSKLNEDQRNVIVESGLFNDAWYRDRYLIEGERPEDCLGHFLTIGIHIDNDPGPKFDSAYYLSTYKDVRDYKAVPLLHYLICGRHEGRLGYQKEELKNGLILTSAFLSNLIERDRCRIGDHTYGTPRVIGDYFARFVIGKYCSIGPDVELILANHRKDFVSTYPFNWLSARWPSAEALATDHISRSDMAIGNDVWIGAKAIVLPGVQIADGAIIGAASVVRVDVPPYAIIAGNPGKIIGYRFEQHIIEQLLRIGWWDWTDEKVAEMLPLIMQDNIEKFIMSFSN